MDVKIKKLTDNAVVPMYAKDGDAGLDLTATSIKYDDCGNIVYGTGLAFEIPKGYVGLLFPRSSNARTNLFLTNSVGVLDSGYRGEVMFKYKPIHSTCNFLKAWWNEYVLRKDNAPITFTGVAKSPYKIGDRIGQLVIVKYPSIRLIPTEELSETERGNGSYGSSGK